MEPRLPGPAPPLRQRSLPSLKTPPAEEWSRATNVAPTGGFRYPRMVRCTDLWGQAVRESRKRLAAVAGHEQQVLQANAAEALAVGPRLDRDDIARDELCRPAATEVGLLVDLQPDAVAEAVEIPLAQHDARLLRALRRMAGRLVEVAAELPERLARHARTGCRAPALEGLGRDPVPLRDLVGDLADHECPRHVGVAAGRVVGRPYVDDDRRSRRQRPGA